MFDVGFTEILLVGVVALVVIGPERLPDVARTAGQWIAKLQRFVRGVKSDIASELDSGDLKKLIGDQRQQIDELRKMVGSTRRELESSTNDIVRGARRKLTEMEDAAARADAGAAAETDATPPLPAPPASLPPPSLAKPPASLEKPPASLEKAPPSLEKSPAEATASAATGDSGERDVPASVAPEPADAVAAPEAPVRSSGSGG